MRLPLTVGVVYIHFSLADGFNIHGVLHGLDNPAWFFFVVNFISEVLARVCVPLFFMISGYLFFCGAEFSKDGYIRKLKSRFWTLLIPFLLWNIIAIIWQLKGCLPYISNFYQPMEVRISIIRIFNTFFANSGNSGILVSSASAKDSLAEVYPINVPLWYVRDIMILVVMSPVIYFLMKKTERIFLVLLGILWFITPVYKLNWGGYLVPFIPQRSSFVWGHY